MATALGMDVSFGSPHVNSNWLLGSPATRHFNIFVDALETDLHDTATLDPKASYQGV